MKAQAPISLDEVYATKASVYTINPEVHHDREAASQSNDIWATNQKEQQKFNVSAILQWMKCYFKKWAGKHEERPPRIACKDLAWTFLGCIMSIGVVAFSHYRLLQQQDYVFLIGSFGATAVLLFAQPKAVVSQPRNMIGGQLLSATVGCIIRLLLVDRERSVAALLSVSISTILMQYTETIHPPAGATALIAVIGVHPQQWKGFLFIFIPVLSAQLIMLLIALIINNIPSNRSYPTFWW